jgi:hypothetical protein
MQILKISKINFLSRLRSIIFAGLTNVWFLRCPFVFNVVEQSKIRAKGNERIKVKSL